MVSIPPFIYITVKFLIELSAVLSDWMRIGAFFFESSTALLTEKLAFTGQLRELEEDCERAIQISGSCILADIRTGIWIAGTVLFMLHYFGRLDITY